MNLKLVIFSLLLVPLISNSQDKIKSDNLIKSNGISVGLNGVEYNQMVSNSLLFELGIGLFGPFAGVNYYITDPTQRRINYYTGISVSKNLNDPLMINIPLGISYFAKNNFQYSFDLGIMIADNIDPNPSPWIGIKVGYRYGDDIAKLKECEKTAFRNIISGQLGGYDVVIGAIYERLLTPYLGTEAGVGIAGASLGAKFYLPSISSDHLNFHIGATQSIGNFGWKTYFPIGVNFLSDGAFRYSFDIGPQIWRSKEDDIRPSFSIRIGKAF